MNDVEKTIQAVLATQLGVPQTEIRREATFIEDLRMDSLDLTELAMTLEERFGIQISIVDLTDVETVADAIRAVEDRIGQS